MLRKLLAALSSAWAKFVEETPSGVSWACRLSSIWSNQMLPDTGVLPQQPAAHAGISCRSSHAAQANIGTRSIPKQPAAAPLYSTSLRSASSL